MPVWDSSYPLGTTQGSLIDDDIRDMKDYLEDALSREHEFPNGNVGRHVPNIPIVKEGDLNIRDGGLAVVENKLYSKQNGQLVLLSAISSYTIPAGTRMIFYQDTAPVGWSILTDWDDRVLYITKGSANGGVAGGSTGGSWTISGFSSNSHTHTASFPHKHTVPIRYDGKLRYGASWGSTSVNFAYGYFAYGDWGSVSIAGWLTSETSFTSTSSSASVTVSHDGSWRPRRAVFIVCEYNG